MGVYCRCYFLSILCNCLRLLLIFFFSCFWMIGMSMCVVKEDVFVLSFCVILLLLLLVFMVYVLVMLILFVENVMMVLVGGL